MGVATTAGADPFRAWLIAQKEQLGSSSLADRLNVTPQTISNWIRGKSVARERVKSLQSEAAKDGVDLTAEQLLGIPSL